jgi:hypothetical protein
MFRWSTWQGIKIDCRRFYLNNADYLADNYSINTRQLDSVLYYLFLLRKDRSACQIILARTKKKNSAAEPRTKRPLGVVVVSTRRQQETAAGVSFFVLLSAAAPVPLTSRSSPLCHRFIAPYDTYYNRSIVKEKNSHYCRTELDA